MFLFFMAVAIVWVEARLKPKTGISHDEMEDTLAL